MSSIESSTMDVDRHRQELCITRSANGPNDIGRQAILAINKWDARRYERFPWSCFPIRNGLNRYVRRFDLDWWSESKISYRRFGVRESQEALYRLWEMICLHKPFDLSLRQSHAWPGQAFLC